MNFQWYPGHMTKAKRQMQEDIKLIDLVIELVDARIPLSSRNPDIDELGKNKYRLILMNKADLADKSGVTKGKQWIRLNKNIELLDTPGILWPKFEDQMVGLRLALIGSIKDEILNVDELAVELIKILKMSYPGTLNNRYEVNEDNDITDIIFEIAKNRNCIQKGGEADYSKACALLIDDFRSGKLGKLTLELPEK